VANAYSQGILQSPRINLTLAERSTVEVLVMGSVEHPGIHILPKYQNDIGHALAAAGGLNREASDEIEVHRRVDIVPGAEQLARIGLEEFEDSPLDPKKMMRIPLRGLPPGVLNPNDVVLGPEDVVV